MRRQFGDARDSLKLFLLALAMACGLYGSAAHADGAVLRSPIGRWLTEDGDGVIEIAPCGPGLCGRIVAMSETSRPDGRPVLDRLGRPQCGLTILRQTGQTDTHVWEGRITNPDDGSDWHCEFWVEADGLHLRGYVLVPLLGKTQIWRPYRGPIRADCKLG